MNVWTRHEKTGDWGPFPVTAVSKEINNRWRLRTADDIEVVASANHRVFTWRGWVEIRDLLSGDMILGHSRQWHNVAERGPVDEGEVIKITVDDAHTYITEGLLSHNIKWYRHFDRFTGALDMNGGGSAYDPDLARVPRAPIVDDVVRPTQPSGLTAIIKKRFK